MQPETVVAYDATTWGSTRHLVRRNGVHVALCGDPLQPFGFIRYAENASEEERDVATADCRPCLFARAQALVSGFDGGVPRSVADEVNRLPEDDADGRIEVLLARILRSTSWQAAVLLREHFPTEIVERAALRAA